MPLVSFTASSATRHYRSHAASANELRRPSAVDRWAAGLREGCSRRVAARDGKLWTSVQRPTRCDGQSDGRNGFLVDAQSWTLAATRLVRAVESRTAPCLQRIA